jgi:ketosteroid isomerase-like protein
VQTKDVVTRYFERANAGDWDGWCDLFATDTVLDEQLAGHIEGQQTLRDMMKTFSEMYPSFTNVPNLIIVDGDEAASFSHISAVTGAGAEVEIEVAIHFRLADGQIAYMANYHDTAGLRPTAGS